MIQKTNFTIISKFFVFFNFCVIIYNAGVRVNINSGFKFLISLLRLLYDSFVYPEAHFGFNKIVSEIEFLR